MHTFCQSLAAGISKEQFCYQTVSDGLAESWKSGMKRDGCSLSSSAHFAPALQADLERETAFFEIDGGLRENVGFAQIAPVVVVGAKGLNFFSGRGQA